MPARSLAAALLALALLFPRAAGAVPIGAACKDDTQCDAGSICSSVTFVCEALPKRHRILPFIWSRMSDSGGFFHIPIGFYYSVWDHDHKTEVQFPFFVRLQNFKEQRDTIAIPPLLTAWSSTPTEKTFRLYPIFFYGKYSGEDAGTQAALLPLFWFTSRYQKTQFIFPLIGSGYSRDEKRDTEFLMTAFLGYFYRDKQTNYRLVLPFFYNKSSPDESTTFVPLALSYFHSTPTRSFGTVFPLVWRMADREKGTDRVLALPLFDYEMERFGRRKRLFSLVAAWEKDEDAKLEQLALFVPPYFHRRDPLRDVDVAPPFFARWKVHEDDSTGWIAGPVYHSQDPEGSTTAVFPLYWGFHDKRSDAGTHLILPIAGWHHGPGLFGLVAGPIFGWRNKNAPGSWGAGIAPLIVFHRDGTKHQELVLPIFARWGDDATKTTTTAVAGAYYRSTPDGWDAGLMPILHFGAHKDRHHVYVAPIFWHRHTPDNDLDVVGPAYFSRGKSGWAAGVAPLFFAAHDVTTGHSYQLVLPPLFVHTVDQKNDQEHLLAGLFYRHRDRAVTTDVLFPLMYLHRTPERATLVSPVAYWHREPKKETLWIGPWFQSRDDRKQSHTYLLFPLWLQHDAPNFKVRVQFPLFWYVRDGAETDLAFFPFYWRVRSPERELDAVFPLFLHTKSATASTTIVGPAWYRAKADGGRTFGVLPLFAYVKTMHDGKAHAWAAAPLVWWAKNDTNGSRDLIVGNFFHFVRGDGYTAGFVPLGFGWKRGTSSGVIAPFFFHGHDSADNSSVNVIFTAYWGQRGPKSYFGFAPLLFHTNDGEGTSNTLLLPLAFFQQRPLGSTLITPIFGYSKSPSGTRAYVGPFYYRNDEGRTSYALWPIAYFTRDKHTGANTKMVLPLFADARGEDGREFQLYSPLVWRYHSVERSIVFGLPLYYDFNTFGESRTTIMVPLFSRTEDRVNNQTTWVFPALLSWARIRRGGADPGTDVVVFPLVWRFGGKDSTTVVFPLWWDFKRGENRTTVLFPVGARWTRPDNDYTLVLNSYYRKGRGPRDGEWFFHFVPLFDFGRPRKKDLEWDVLEGLLGYSRQGLNRTLRIFWLIEIKLDPAPANSVSFFGSTPPSARTEL